MSLPVESGPTTARDRAWMTRQSPVLGAILESIQRHDSIARKLYLDDSIDDITACKCCQTTMTQHTLYLGERDERGERVVQNWENCRGS